MQDKSVRCDNCGSEAWVSVFKDGTPSSELNFCAHHYGKHSTMLHAQGWIIGNDERGLINSAPSPSANAVA